MNTVIIKRYSSDFEAQNDAEYLEAHGIRCAINGSLTESVLPYLQNAITIAVMENDKEKAEELLKIASEN